ncbi:hypothetical protein [Nostoc commune]|nr:hypothetical protein [Nostoc commune]
MMSAMRSLAGLVEVSSTYVYTREINFPTPPSLNIVRSHFSMGIITNRFT